MSLRNAMSLLLLAVALAAPLRAQQTPAESAQRLIEQERLREQLLESIQRSQRTFDDGDVQNENFVEAVDRVVDLGPDVTPLVVRELQQNLPSTFFFSAYALGRLGTPEAEAALREAVARAEEEPTDYARTRKAWACYGLGLMGRDDALDLLNRGRHLSAGTPIHGLVSTLEAIAIQTAPAGLPRLHAQLERYTDEQDPRMTERGLVLEALARVGDPQSLPTLERVLAEAHPLLRKKATHAIGKIPGERSVTLLLQALDDPDIRVRRGAARGLQDAVPVGRLERPLAKLETEEDPLLRGALYHVVALAGGAPAVEPLGSHWGRPDPRDRAKLVEVLGSLRSPEALPLLARALEDRDGQVLVAAARALGELGSEPAVDRLIGAVGSPFWSLAQTAVEQLVRGEHTRGAGAIAARLIEVELASVVVDPHRRERARMLAQALGALQDPVRLPELREAAARQTDPQLVDTLRQSVTRLEAQRRNGVKVKRWVEELAAADVEIRHAAYTALGRAGGETAAAALAATFGRVEADEGAAILRALGAIDSPSSRRLIERVLLEPAFDPIQRSQLRDLAAWGARRIGGEAMFAALQAAVDRREGRDVTPLIYLAQLGGQRALPTLERWRLRRMHYLKWSRGDELETLDWIRRQLQAGGSIAALDVPPERLTLRR